MASPPLSGMPKTGLRAFFSGFKHPAWGWVLSALAAFFATLAPEIIRAICLVFAAIVATTTFHGTEFANRALKKTICAAILFFAVAGCMFWGARSWDRRNQQASSPLPPKADAQVDVDKLAESLSKKYPPQVVNRDHTIAQEAAGASDSATIHKNPLKHPTPVTSTGPKVQETPAKDRAAPVTVIQVATPFGNLKDRAVALSQEIMDDLYKHGWPYTDNHNLPPPTSSIVVRQMVVRQMPRDREGLRAWMRTRGLVFRLEYLPKVRAITNEFSEFHIRDQQLDQFLETEKMIQQANEQMTARGAKVTENPLFPQQIEDVAERLMVMAERIK